jgi:hypothetical protein
MHAMSQSLEPVRGLEIVWRGVYEVVQGGHTYAVEVDFLDLGEKVHLYRDGARIETQKSPASFDVGGGIGIEAAMGLLGMKDLKVTGDGGWARFRPAAGTAEAWRAHFDREHPTASRVVGTISLVVLVVALLLEIPQLIGVGARALGVDLELPLELPPVAAAALGFLALAALLERALRFKHNRWID